MGETSQYSVQLIGAEELVTCPFTLRSNFIGLGIEESCEARMRLARMVVVVPTSIDDRRHKDGHVLYLINVLSFETELVICICCGGPG